MLGKLFKYEIKASARIFLPLYASLILFAIINNIFIRINNSSNNNQLFMNIMQGISTFAYVFLIISIFVFTLFVMIQRFYKNLLGDEGYLMFTLPVRTGEHIAAKLLASMMWVITSVIMTLFSVMLIAYNEKFFASFQEAISQILTEINRVFGVNGYAYIVEFAVFILMVLATNILMIYASISVGQMISKHKLLGSFGAYMGFYLISQFIISIILVIGYSAGSRHWTSIENIMQNNTTIPHFLFAGIMLLNLVFAAAYYTITNLILSRRLNLE
ncbi:MAG TPA: ABC transporter permease [Clostridiales bacterium]|nr:ABC transporter permease [Clostridiales bacterium]